jgi:hypothetical protein
VVVFGCGCGCGCGGGGGGSDADDDNNAFVDAGKAFAHPLIVELAAKYKKSSAQILGRWCVQKSIIYIPKSVKKERMVENAEVFDFVIDDADMEKLDGLTTPETLETFKELYIKCVTRDTPLAGTDEAKKITKTDITVG